MFSRYTLAGGGLQNRPYETSFLLFSLCVCVSVALIVVYTLHYPVPFFSLSHGKPDSLFSAR